MKVYRTLGMGGVDPCEGDLQMALDDGDRNAVDILEVEAEEVTNRHVRIQFPDITVVYSKHSYEADWYDTREEAREAMLRFINGRITKLAAMQVNYIQARDYLLRMEVENDNQA